MGSSALLALPQQAWLKPETTTGKVERGRKWGALLRPVEHLVIIFKALGHFISKHAASGLESCRIRLRKHPCGDLGRMRALRTVAA